MKLSYVRIFMVAGLIISLTSSPAVEASSASGTPGTTSEMGGSMLKVGESFLHARARVIRLGWKPIRMHINDAYEYDGAEQRLVDRGFREVDSCSIDAGANCILYYRMAGRCLRLDTVGEQVDEMKVTRWTNECPPGNNNAEPRGLHDPSRKLRPVL